LKSGRHKTEIGSSKPVYRTELLHFSISISQAPMSVRVLVLAKHMPNVSLPSRTFFSLCNLEKEKLPLVQACKAAPTAVKYKPGISGCSITGRVNRQASPLSNNFTTYNEWKLAAHF
jgi:hypothetical protein